MPSAVFDCKPGRGGSSSGMAPLPAGLSLAHSGLPGVVKETVRADALKLAKVSLEYGKPNRGSQTLNQGPTELKKIVPELQTLQRANQRLGS